MAGNFWCTQNFYLSNKVLHDYNDGGSNNKKIIHNILTVVHSNNSWLHWDSVIGAYVLKSRTLTHRLNCMSLSSFQFTLLTAHNLWDRMLVLEKQTLQLLSRITYFWCSCFLKDIKTLFVELSARYFTIWRDRKIYVSETILLTDTP